MNDVVVLRDSSIIDSLVSFDFGDYNIANLRNDCEKIFSLNTDDDSKIILIKYIFHKHLYRLMEGDKAGAEYEHIKVLDSIKRYIAPLVFIKLLNSKIFTDTIWNWFDYNYKNGKT